MSSLTRRTRALKYQKFCLTTFWYLKRNTNKHLSLGLTASGELTIQTFHKLHKAVREPRIIFTVLPWGDKLKTGLTGVHDDMNPWSKPNQISWTPDWDPHQQELNVCWLSLQRVYHQATFNLFIWVYVKAGHSWTQFVTSQLLIT